jgi:hypothetical protein
LEGRWKQHQAWKEVRFIGRGIIQPKRCSTCQKTGTGGKKVDAGLNQRLESEMDCQNGIRVMAQIRACVRLVLKYNRWEEHVNRKDRSWILVPKYQLLTGELSACSTKFFRVVESKYWRIRM